MWEKMLLSFSAKRNLKSICNFAVNVDTIPSIHGLKALSMAWVILGHTCIVIFKYSGDYKVPHPPFFFITQVYDNINDDVI